MDEKKQEREEAREDEQAEQGPEVEEQIMRGRGRDEGGAEEDQGSGEEERGEQDMRKFSDARLKAGVSPLR